jgi:hypothetical protein
MAPYMNELPGADLGGDSTDCGCPCNNCSCTCGSCSCNCDCIEAGVFTRNVSYRATNEGSMHDVALLTPRHQQQQQADAAYVT